MGGVLHDAVGFAGASCKENVQDGWEREKNGWEKERGRWEKKYYLNTSLYIII